MPWEPQAIKSPNVQAFKPLKFSNSKRSVRNSNGNPFEKRLERIARAVGNGGKNVVECSQQILLIRSTRLILDEVVCGMKSNELNRVGHPDPKKDRLLRLGNRVKTLRLKAGHHQYERFAFEHDISRITGDAAN
jgi:hypothetical protein